MLYWYSASWERPHEFKPRLTEARRSVHIGNSYRYLPPPSNVKRRLRAAGISDFSYMERSPSPRTKSGTGLSSKPYDGPKHPSTGEHVTGLEGTRYDDMWELHKQNPAVARRPAPPHGNQHLKDTVFRSRATAWHLQRHQPRQKTYFEEHDPFAWRPSRTHAGTGSPSAARSPSPPQQGEKVARIRNHATPPEPLSPESHRLDESASAAGAVPHRPPEINEAIPSPAGSDKFAGTQSAATSAPVDPASNAYRTEEEGIRADSPPRPTSATTRSIATQAMEEGAAAPLTTDSTPEVPASSAPPVTDPTSSNRFPGPGMVSGLPPQSTRGGPEDVVVGTVRRPDMHRIPETGPVMMSPTIGSDVWIPGASQQCTTCGSPLNAQRYSTAVAPPFHLQHRLLVEPMPPQLHAAPSTAAIPVSVYDTAHPIPYSIHSPVVPRRDIMATAFQPQGSWSSANSSVHRTGPHVPPPRLRSSQPRSREGTDNDFTVYHPRSSSGLRDVH